MHLPHTGWFRHEPGDEVVRLLREGHFEAAEQAFVWRFLRPGDTVVDGGAHIGIYSVIASRAMHGDGRVIAFEPTPGTVRLLRENLEKNDAGKVEVVEAALWSRKTRLHLTAFKKGMSAHNFAATGKERGAVPVAATDLASYCRKAGIERIDLLKIDTEGAEPKVLAGARSLLKAGACDVVLVEFTEENLKRAGTNSDALASTLKEAGYSLWKFDDATGDPVPFEIEGPVWYRNILALRNPQAVMRRLSEADASATQIAADILGRAAACQKFKELEELDGLRRKASELDHFREWAESSDRNAAGLKELLADSEARLSVLQDAVSIAGTALDEDARVAEQKSGEAGAATNERAALDALLDEARKINTEARREALEWMERTLAWRKLDREREAVLEVETRRGKEAGEALARNERTIEELRARLSMAAEDRAAEIQALTDRHLAATKELGARHEDMIDSLRQTHSASLLDAGRLHEKDIGELRAEHAASLALILTQHKDEQAETRKFHESQLEAMRKQHEHSLETLQGSHAAELVRIRSHSERMLSEAGESHQKRESELADEISELGALRDALGVDLESMRENASFERARADTAEALVASLLAEARDTAVRIARLEKTCALWDEKHGQAARAADLFQAHFDATAMSRVRRGGAGALTRVGRPPPRVSVVICTHNPKARLLGQAMRSIAVQTIAARDWELVVVDNASNPPVNFKALGITPARGTRLLREPTPGLTNARLAGFAASRAPLIVCVDDDNVLAPNYLERAVEVADKNPDLGAFGGSSDPVFEVPPADWVRPILPNLALRHYGPEPITSAAMHWGKWEPIGAGLVLRRAVAEEFAKFIQERAEARVLGRTGNNLLGAEDSLIARIAVKKNFNVSYQPSLSLLHHIPARRVQPSYLRRLMFCQGRSHVILNRLTGQHMGDPPKGDELVRHLRSLRKWRIANEGPSGRIQWFWDCGFHYELINGKAPQS